MFCFLCNVSLSSDSHHHFCGSGQRTLEVFTYLISSDPISSVSRHITVNFCQQLGLQAECFSPDETFLKKIRSFLMINKIVLCITDNVVLCNLFKCFCQAQVQVQVGWRSVEGQVWVRKVRVRSESYELKDLKKHKLKDLDLSYTLNLVFTTHPPPTQTFFLAFKGSRQVRWT